MATGSWEGAGFADALFGTGRPVLLEHAAVRLRTLMMAFQDQGWSPDRYEGLGFAWIVRSHAITFVQPARLDDEIVVEPWVANIKKVTSLRRYRIVNGTDATILAEAETDWAFISRTRMAPQRIPPEVSGAFQVIEAPPAP